jgi:hypothetical protein
MMLQMVHDHTATGADQGGFQRPLFFGSGKEMEKLPHYYCPGIASSQKQRQIEDAFSGDKTKTELTLNK